MSERAEDIRIKELEDQGIELYSISKLDAINNCLYDAYLTYRLNNRGGNNIYALMGSKLHDVLEGMANGTAKKEDLLPAMEAELEDMDMLGIKFPSDKIRDGWVKDITHFCKTFDFPKNLDFTTEQLFIYKTDDGHYIRGYIDLIDNLGGNQINIFDHKSSSMYSSKDMDEHARQLIVYMLGKEQEGIKVKQVAWHFMKYVNVLFYDKGKEKHKIVERRKIAEEMGKYVEQALLADGYDDIDINMIMMKFKNTNDFNDLPEETRSQFIMQPCIVYYDVDNEAIQECKKYIKDTIEKWESLKGKDISAYSPRKFYKIQKNGKTAPDVFICLSLCGHNKDCPYIRDYLEAHPLPKKEEEI